MTRFLAVPQLPQGRVSALALGARYRGLLQKPLEKLEITPFFLADAPELEPRIAAHADLSLLHLGGERFAAREGLSLDYPLPLITKVPSYLGECALNCCAVGRRWLCCQKTAAVVPEGFEPVYVNQRYTRCSVCIVDGQSIITADRGVARASRAAGLDVLLIEPGHIALPGYRYGFLGGASFKLNADVMAFTGTLNAHPDKHRIEAFLRMRQITPLYLTAEPLLDIGSAVLLTEDISALPLP